MNKEVQLYLAGMSISEVSKATGIPPSTLSSRFKILGVTRSLSEAMTIAQDKSKTGSLKWYTYEDGNRISFDEISERSGGLHRTSIEYRIKQIKAGRLPESDLCKPSRCTELEKDRPGRSFMPKDRRPKSQPKIVNGWLML